MLEAKGRREFAFCRQKTDLWRAYCGRPRLGANFSKGSRFEPGNLDVFYLVNRETAAAWSKEAAGILSVTGGLAGSVGIPRELVRRSFNFAAGVFAHFAGALLLLARGFSPGRFPRLCVSS
jgi:hypothetical protein